ncbi:Type II toxin-antitoxin system ParD family antitoxin [Hyphomicrobiales bacterium]|nr:Type II toxin-antitoxin system ParD family antitoxin [Hyphomicrobiales bacterium]CAH1697196.1 Type II toxin-antitoxin system ParD family antitoxin [Hyphomicrobiales bacterium]CAI0342764.1 antitoxin ParD1/3/4 [Hyphomicrobiales bacterium]
MPTGEMTVTLPPELAKLVEVELVSGRYASMVEVLRDALQALAERDEALEHWLREDIVAGHAEYLADPSAVVAASDVLARVKSRRHA